MSGFKSAVLLGALFGLAHPAAAGAQDVAVEGNLVRAQGHWGGELGLGYSLHAGPITLRPIGGLLIHSDNDEREVKPYAKAEATVTIPALAEVGAGARISGDRTRIYGTAAFDLLPKLKLKGNLGDHYAAIGILGQF
ncbi:hypothetical protein GGC65_004196 [Sphingopyxis sp. OAS728]|uniref:hypothetical protein n=1 Tax=Sphingopyxis sp. OAS728 TaxID=2663823 RepID=UPI0019E6BF94|nr:hypothetical protein [Sphingopyxis sp. OAS728]MBE1529740.1 hypothetical protein [Sphingopyxis sp. OAS728]